MIFWLMIFGDRDSDKLSTHYSMLNERSKTNIYAKALYTVKRYKQKLNEYIHIRSDIGSVSKSRQ